MDILKAGLSITYASCPPGDGIIVIVIVYIAPQERYSRQIKARTPTPSEPAIAGSISLSPLAQALPQSLSIKVSLDYKLVALFVPKQVGVPVGTYYHIQAGALFQARGLRRTYSGISSGSVKQAKLGLVIISIKINSILPNAFYPFLFSEGPVISATISAPPCRSSRLKRTRVIMARLQCEILIGKQQAAQLALSLKSRDYYYPPFLRIETAEYIRSLRRIFRLPLTIYALLRVSSRFLYGLVLIPYTKIQP